MKFLFFFKIRTEGCFSRHIHYAFFCCFLISTMAHCNIKTDLSWVSVHSFSTWVFPEIYRTNNHTYSADWCYPDNLTLCKSCKFRNHFYVFHVGWVVWWWWNWRQCLCKLLTLAMLPLKKKKIGQVSEVLKAQGAQLIVPVALLHAAAFAFGYWLSRISSFGESTSRTISIECGMQVISCLFSFTILKYIESF